MVCQISLKTIFGKCLSEIKNLYLPTRPGFSNLYSFCLWQTILFVKGKKIRKAKLGNAANQNPAIILPGSDLSQHSAMQISGKCGGEGCRRRDMGDIRESILTFPCDRAEMLILTLSEKYAINKPLWDSSQSAPRDVCHGGGQWKMIWKFNESKKAYASASAS